MPAEKMTEFWEENNSRLKQAIADRIEEGRGVEGLVDDTLPTAISELE